MGGSTTGQNNGAMARYHKSSRAVRRYRQSRVFDWEAEPVEERPREFVPTKGYSVFWSFSPLGAVSTRGARPQVGFGTLLAAMII